jgi:tetratricopeptide (TPR) repeat protein
MEYDVFISYPHKDATEVDQIHKALQDIGLKVWRDKIEICDFESITKSIVEGLARSKVLLAYYSLNYWRSRACQWELTAAFLAAQSEGDPRKRVLIINPEEKAEHIHPVELRDELFLTKFKDAESLEHLASSVKNHIQGITNVIGEIHALKQPRWYGNKGVGSNRFVGRLPDMWKIHSILHASGVPVITRSYASPVVQVQGMGGVGKSLLAEEYAMRFAAAFPGGVFWLRAYGNDGEKVVIKLEELEAERTSQIFYLAVAYGISVKDLSHEEIEAKLFQELEKNKKPFLWVVDDIPTGLKVETLKRWFAPNSLGKTLITTRSKEYSVMGKLVTLGVFEPEEAYDLLTLWRKPENEEEDLAAHMLIDDLGYHALAVEVAGSALYESEGLQSFSEFRRELANPTSDELELATELIGILPTGHEKSIASTLFRSTERLGEEGQDFLLLASLLAVAPIPPLLISAAFSEVDDIDESSGKRRAKIALSQVDSLSLAERSEDEPGARSVHVLISRTIRFMGSVPDRSEKLRNAAVSILIKKLSITNDCGIHNELRLDIIHARALASSKEDILTANLIAWVARYDKLQGAYESSKKLLQRAWDIETRILGVEHPSTLSTMSSLASTLYYSGDYEKARKFIEQTLRITRKVLGDEHPYTLSTMNSLAITLYYQGDYAGARNLNEQVLELKRKALGEEHLSTLSTMNNLAATLSDQGDYARARDFYERVLEKQRKVLGDGHPDTLNTINNLASTLIYQGDYVRARNLYGQVLELRRGILGAEHPDTLTTMNDLAVTIGYQGDYAGARNLHGQVLELRREILGDEHPNTLNTMSNLAVTLSDQGDYAGARNLKEQVLELERKILGDEHPNTLSTMNGLAVTLRKQGDYAGARNLYEQVLKLRRKILSDEHPDTLTTMNGLAVTLSDQGDYAGAIKLYEQVLELRWKILGAEHPDTLTTMNDLAVMLNDQGDYVRARNLYEQVLELWQKIFGAEHPTTLTAMSNLAVTLSDQGDYAGARNLHGQVLELRRKILGDEHPNTLSTLNNLAVTLNKQGDYMGARNLYEQVLELRRKILGAEHPSTLSTMNGLAVMLHAHRDYAEARNLYEHILELQRKILGEKHPSTLFTMNNLAATLSDQGDYMGAIKLYEHVLELRRKILGAEHPDTLTTMNDLAVTLSDQDEIAGAINLFGQVLELRRKILGVKHPDTLKTINNLSITLSKHGNCEGS